MGEGPAHRFTRGGGEHVDLMVADHLGPDRRPRFGGHSVLEAPGATGTLRYHTVDCVIRREDEDDGQRIVFSPRHSGRVVAQGRRPSRRQPRSRPAPRRRRGPACNGR